jgi:hypothetical protein
VALKIEFLEEGSDNCPLIRIFGNDVEAYNRLKLLFEQLASGAVLETKLYELAGVEAIESCSVIALASQRDLGANRCGDAFWWELTPGAWDNVAGLLAPFSQADSAGFQWLDCCGDIKVLVSLDGCW